ncbi:MAG: hypothetical protein ABW178_01695 [Pseudoxanthomonas sp.]
MRIYSVAVYIEKSDTRGVVYVGDAVIIGDDAWLVLTWDSDDKLYPVEKLPLDEGRLIRSPPPDIAVEADWYYVITMSPPRRLQ